MARFQNREKVLARLARLPRAVKVEVSKAMQEGANEITAMQRRLVPVRSGELKNSIRNVRGNYTPDNPNVRGFGGARGGDPDLTIHLVAGNAKAWYASLVEFGTKPHLNKGRFRGTQHPGTTAQPYFYPAYRSLQRRYKGRVTRVMKKVIKRTA
jgi:HK97 gp10 family phage protein